MLIGIDLGTVRTGIAITDPSERFALPSATLTNGEDLIEKLAAVARSHGKNLSAIVVGSPLHANGAHSPASARAGEFVKKLENLVDVPVVLYDERKTTVIAKGLLKETGGNKKKMTDQVAAQTILQSYVDALFDKDTEGALTLAQIRQQAKEMELPSVRAMTARHIVQQLKEHGHAELLEVGTANGYSAAYFAYCLPFLQITTLEKSKDRFEMAEKNLAALKRVRVMHADAFTYQDGKIYDAAFIDGPKSRVSELFEKYYKLVKIRGTVFVDNTKLTAVRESPYLNTDRQRMRMVENMDAFFEELKKPNPNRSVVVHDFDDGLAVVQKLA